MITPALAPARAVTFGPGYVAYLAAATTARVGDAMWPAVVLLVLARTGDPVLAGLTMAGATFPTLVSAPLLGAWLDRTRHRRAALALNQVALVVALAGLLLAAGRAPAPLLPALAVLAGLTQPLVTGGYTSLLPGLVPAAALPRAHALEAASYNAAYVAGPALAGLLCALSPEAGVAGQMGMALVPLAILPRLRVAASGDPVVPRSPLVQDVLDGLRVLVRVPELRSATTTTVLAAAAQGLFVVAVPAEAARLTGETSAAGWLWAALALGGVLGGLLFARLDRRWPAVSLVVAGAALEGVAFVAWAVAPGLAASVALAVVAGVPGGAVLAALFAVRATYAPPELRSRVFTGAAGLKIAALSVGAALSGPAVEAVGPGGTLGAAGVVCLMAAAIGGVLLRPPARARPPARRGAGRR